MPLTPSQRPPREWSLLLLALVLVGAFCIPIWHWTPNPEPATDAAERWTPERLSRLLLGPEQIACYCCFTWGCFIVAHRYLELRRQRQAFRLGLLPTEEGERILREDAQPLRHKLEAVTGGRPYILANVIRQALGRYAVSRSSADASEAVRTQAELDLGRLVTSMATVHYLAWAIPALGFLGTVRGLSGALSLAGRAEDDSLRAFLDQATRHLNVAFDCTLVALALSLGIMFLIHSVQRDEEILVLDCQQYCQEHLIHRLYDPAAVPEDVA